MHITTQPRAPKWGLIVHKNSKKLSNLSYIPIWASPVHKSQPPYSLLTIHPVLLLLKKTIVIYNVIETWKVQSVRLIMPLNSIPNTAQLACASLIHVPSPHSTYCTISIRPNFTCKIVHYIIHRLSTLYQNRKKKPSSQRGIQPGQKRMLCQGD